MDAKLPGEVADKVALLGPPSEEFAGGDNEHVNNLKTAPWIFLLGCIAIAGSTYYLTLRLAGSEQGDRLKLAFLIVMGLLLTVLAGIGGWRLMCMRWLVRLMLRLTARPREAVLRAVRVRFMIGGSALVGSLVLLPCVVTVGLHDIRAGGAVLGGIIGQYCLLGSAFALVRAYRNWRIRVLVYPERLIVIQGRSMRDVGWHEILFLCQGALLDRAGHSRFPLFGRPDHPRVVDAERYRLVLKPDGRIIDFGRGIPRVDQLGAIVRQESLKVLLPEYLASFQAGKALYFGGLRVTREGISHEKQTIPWSAIENMQIDADGLFRIGAREYTWHTFPAWEVPNLHVLQALADHGRKTPATVAGAYANLAREITDDLLNAISSGSSDQTV